MSAEKTVVLGDEYDDDLRDALRGVLSSLGAVRRERSWGLGGSQEIETMVVAIDGKELTIEAETYIGLTLSGDADLVTRIAERVAAVRVKP